ncbi:MAG TPA: hypothetical protein VFV95_09810 [Vicinamibacterales bacterium]|nr:hypothetical protein [Vicinamibacterales bacterium]
MNPRRTRPRGNLAGLLIAVVLVVSHTARAQKAPDLPRLAATYVRGFVEQLSNVVAQEDFEFRKPAQTVRSELLLVRYPGSRRQFLTFRDVTMVNGQPRTGRKERLSDLFEQGFEDAQERALQIAADSAPHVPAVLNPLYAIGLLQTSYQSRFRFGEKDAGKEWPRTVKGLTFVETARPTLIQSGPFANQNVPTRGTAWIDTVTGRVLQTDLEVRDGRDVTKIVTRFAPDKRLGVMVPIEMRTEKPDATARYTNFRRFEVKTEERLQDPVTREVGAGQKE